MSLPKSSQEQLRQYIERIERIEDERKGLGDDIKDIYLEAKATGFDPKIMRKLIAIRKKPKTERDEEEALIETYLAALGMAGTPMGEYLERSPEMAD